MKILVYLPENELKPQGGPFAVGYYYREEMNHRNEKIVDFLPDCNLNRGTKRPLGHRILKMMPQFINQWYWDNKQAKSLRDFVSNPIPFANVDLCKYDIIHFHSSFHLFREKEKLANYKGIVILQSHSPLPQGQEYLIDIPKRVKNKVKNIDKMYESVDRYAFNRADYIIFPCKEAEEPYSENWAYFQELKEKNKEKFKYVITGIPQSIPVKTRSEILTTYNIPTNDFVISYVGRHNTVKGFDILKKIARILFDKDPNIWVISAGKEEPYTRLEHSRWKEIGYINDPASFIAASDVFILPNRVTYFDIVMIEILSLGKIVIASRTGGNKFFENNGVKGVFLYDTIEEAVAIVQQIKFMDPLERKKLGQENAEFYSKNLSVASMYDSYKKCIKEISTQL